MATAARQSKPKSQVSWQSLFGVRIARTPCIECVVEALGAFAFVSYLVFWGSGL